MIEFAPGNEPTVEEMTSWMVRTYGAGARIRAFALDIVPGDAIAAAKMAEAMMDKDLQRSRACQSE